MRVLLVVLFLAGCGEPEPPGVDVNGLAMDYAFAVPRRLRFDVAIAIEDSLSREEWVAEWLSRSMEDLLGGCESVDLQVGVLRGDAGALQGDGVISFDSDWPTSDPAAELARRSRFDDAGSGLHEPLHAFEELVTKSASFVRSRSIVALISLGRADDTSSDAPEAIARSILNVAGEDPGRILTVAAIDGPSPRHDAFARAITDGGGQGQVEPLESAGTLFEPIGSFCPMYQFACGPDLYDDDGAPVADGEHARCILTETRPDHGPCGLARFERPTGGDATVCQLCQEGDGTAPFDFDVRDEDVTACATQPPAWRYRVDGGCPTFELTPEGRLVENGTVRIECLVRLVGLE